MIHHIEANAIAYNTQFQHGTVPSTLHPTVECQASLFNIYNTSPVGFSFYQPMKQTVHSVDSSITFNSEKNVTSSSLRKRPREEEESIVVNPKHCTNPLMFLGQDFSFDFQQHNFDIDRTISNHVERMRIEMEEKRKIQRRKLMEVAGEKLMKTLKAKDAEINHVGKLNLFLEEKVKSLCVENQIWRDMAQSNEATVNTLRSNLQQALSAAERNRWEEPTTVVADDEQSCCGSSDEGHKYEEMRKIVGEAQVSKRRRTITSCRNCGEGEASVLLLPCRHMCLCTVCGSSMNTCPICKSPKNASLHVNLLS